MAMPPTRVRRPLLALLGALALFVLLVPPGALAAPLEGTFVGKLRGREVSFRHNGKDRTEWAGLLSFKLASGKDVPVFCIQLDVHVRPGDPYTSDGTILDLPNGCQIRYLLDKYPAASAKTADEAAARQLAIWFFSDGLDLSTVTDAAVRDRAAALANEAKGKPCPPHRSEAPTLTLDPPAASASAGQPIMYTLRASPAEAGAKLTLAVDGPAVFSDAGGANSGQQQSQIALDAQGNAQFWVLGTGAGQSAITIALPYNLGAGTVFSERDPNNPSQHLVLAQGQPLTVSVAGRAAWAAQAPSPTVTATATATATATTVPPTATPKRRPRATPQPTATPQETATSQEQTATPAEQTAVPSEVPQEQTATPAEQNQQTTEVAASATPNGATSAQVRPRSLPRTADDGRPPVALFLMGVLAIVAGGWLLRSQRGGK